jgi:hypothetical protein
VNLSAVPVTPVEPERAIERGATGDVVVLTVRGCLDGAAGAALVKAAADAASDLDPSRIDIDLCAVTGFTPEGARWLLRCRRLSGDLRDGLHYRTGRGPGAEALLVAYADE